MWQQRRPRSHWRYAPKITRQHKAEYGTQDEARSVSGDDRQWRQTHRPMPGLLKPSEAIRSSLAPSGGLLNAVGSHPEHMGPPTAVRKRGKVIQHHTEAPGAVWRPAVRSHPRGHKALSYLSRPWTVCRMCYLPVYVITMLLPSLYFRYSDYRVRDQLSASQPNNRSTVSFISSSYLLHQLLFLLFICHKTHIIMKYTCKN